jgi:alpha-beta hydrolase superfamily lysophospholipase
MNWEEFEWRCKDGTRMYACEWKPAGQPKAVIGIVHGMGEHAVRYSHVAEMLNAEGYAVLTFDQRGHGRTEGKRGHVASYEELLEGVDLMVGEMGRRHPQLPLFLFGHSMGGNVTINYLLKRKPGLTGAIISGPWLKLAFQPSQLKVISARLIAWIVPKFTESRPMQGDHLTSDPVMLKRYREDPLGHGSITARFFTSVRRAGLWALAYASELTVPTLLMHGGSDQVTSIQASRQFAEKAGKLCEFMEWPGFKHELHNELKREEVFSVMRSWLRERIPAN